ncbi:MAG: pyridoxine 5'-phosphate synthase [Verrucomicrobiota bacterium]
MLKLGVNIDHIATVRQARYRGGQEPGITPEPSPVEAAKISLDAGAHSITAHLREDRRHIQDDDVQALRKDIDCILNLEMAATREMVDFALALKPDEVCLVPEKREEVTTEGGLEIAGQLNKIKETTARLQDADITVSLFIDPHEIQVAAAGDTGAKCIELHTGAYANAQDGGSTSVEIENLEKAAQQAESLGMQVNAGHGLNYINMGPIKAIPQLDTLNIGHAIVSRAVFVGMNQAVREMVSLMHK